MHKRQWIWSISSIVFVLGSTTCMLLAFLTEETGWMGRLLADLRKDGTGPGAGLDGILTLLLVTSLAAGLLALAAGIVSMIYCGFPVQLGAGSARGSSRVHLTWFDRIFTEIQLTLGILATCGLVPAVYLMENWYQHSGVIRQMIAARLEMKTSYMRQLLTSMAFNGYYSDSQYMTPNWVSLCFALLIMALAFAFDLLILQAIMKKLRNHGFWRGTLLGWIALQIIRLAEKDDKLYRKTFVLVIAGVLLSMTWVGAVFVIIMAIVFLPKYLTQFRSIREGTSAIKDGDLTLQIPVEGEGQLAQLAGDINAITRAQHTAIQRELKTQRMRTDLITNVSHDLRTPLTSMVTYVDLLKQEGLTGEHAPEYLQVLDEKTQRLQKLSEDLFEAAKASSGDIPVEMETLELNALIQQALAEMEDQLAKQELQIIMTDRTEDSHVRADGRHLWRVMENLLGNMSKYAMPGSRAYVDLSDAGQFVRMEFKNMSREALNIDPDDLMERFRRGDDARTTEGSGLGLSIARDLVRLMDGRFVLTIDGDLFKVTVELPRSA